MVDYLLTAKPQCFSRMAGSVKGSFDFGMDTRTTEASFPMRLNVWPPVTGGVSHTDCQRLVVTHLVWWRACGNGEVPPVHLRQRTWIVINVRSATVNARQAGASRATRKLSSKTELKRFLGGGFRFGCRRSRPGSRQRTVKRCHLLSTAHRHVLRRSAFLRRERSGRHS